MSNEIALAVRRVLPRRQAEDYSHHRYMGPALEAYKPTHLYVATLQTNAKGKKQTISLRTREADTPQKAQALLWTKHRAIATHVRRYASVKNQDQANG